MSSKLNKRGTVSDNISALINTTPNLIEAEEDDLTTIEQIKSHEEDIASDEIELGKFRKLNIELLDADDDKYLGRKVSRKLLSDDNAFGDDSSDVELSSEDDQTESAKVEEEEDSSVSEDDEDVDMEGSNEEEEEEEDANLTEFLKEDNFKHLSSKSSNDIEKGNAIRNQIAIWDNLLECRIKFQKCLVNANQLPQLEQLNQFKKNDEFKNLVLENEKSYKHLLCSLLELQDIAINLNPEVQLEPKSKKHSLEEDEEVTSDSDTETVFKPNKSKKIKLTNISETLNTQYNKLKHFRDDTIQKWNDKTRVSQMNSKNFSAFEQSTLKQIEQVLSDKDRLIKRTQLKRSSYQILGCEDDDVSPLKRSKLESNDYNSEIFDDDDFYHQLLRELLERKSNDVTDPVQLGRQWIQLQKLRSKMKRNIDTRATKGRKIKYVVHQKLVNFMMPVADNNWTDEAKNELFSSLFGKNKS